MQIRNTRVLRTVAATAASMTLAAAGLTLATASPAQAAPRCNGSKPGTFAGKFKNNTDQTIMVKGDKYVGKDSAGKAKYKTVEVAVGRNGGTALGAGVCDADFIKTYWDWLYNGTELVDGDSWRKIQGSWSCWNTPGTGYRINCG
ncbi:hypothetical protein AB0G04_22760 [Actinoplanes sp. NPDC023801]|uniref:hypothetical protein n=1 Tax=Actinoplanes sp. NPDC023801 TaxID=3154595 RepID=UPI00340FD112